MKIVKNKWIGYLIFFMIPIFLINVIGYWPPSYNHYIYPIGEISIGIYQYIDNTGQEIPFYQCTTGYSAVKSGIKGIVTAGHCFDGTLGDFTPPAVWWWKVYQPNNLNINWFLGSPSNVYGDLAYIDSAFIPNSNVRPKILTLDPYGNPTELPVKGYIFWWNVPLGEQVFKTGSSSGVSGGMILFKSRFYGDLRWVIGIENMSVSEGDSGGPVYTRRLVRIDSLYTYEIYLLSILSAIDTQQNIVLTISVDKIRSEVGIFPITG